ncbi:MAG: tyrosine-type recombinase/integrase [Bacillota bacterium]
MPQNHRPVYRFILGTGLRRQEAVDLIWGDVHLDSPTPFLALRAKATKARRADTLPLRADIATELKQLRGDANDADSVFPAFPSMAEHRGYLKAAGIPWEDEQGRRADFHALRHTYGTLLSKAGVSPREAMELMRHTDLRLTMKVYTDPRLFDLAGAVEKLPLPTFKPAAIAQQANGTDGKAINQDIASVQVADRVATATLHGPSLPPMARSSASDNTAVNAGAAPNCKQKPPIVIDRGLVHLVGLEPTTYGSVGSRQQTHDFAIRV